MQIKMKIKEPLKKYHIVSHYDLEVDTYDTYMEHSDDLEELTVAARESFNNGRRDTSYIVQLVRVIKPEKVPVATVVEDV